MTHGDKGIHATCHHDETRTIIAAVTTPSAAGDTLRELMHTLMRVGRWRRRLALLAPLLVAGVGSRGAGQTPIVRDSIHAAKTLFTWRDGVLATGFAGLTMAIFPVDRSFARRLQDSTNQANHFFKNASRGIQYVADPGSIVIGVSLYGIGRVAHWRNVADLGLHGTEAVALSGTITALIKDMAGRARPYVSHDTSAHDFGVGRGLTRGDSYQSFPSGHATVAFAAAAVVTSESERWGSHAVWLVGPAMYGGATLVALSRMYNNAHWASDVVLGAAIGTFSGIKVVRYTHGHSNNPIDRRLLGVQLLPTPSGGVGMGWTVTR
jgi:membrane-associated phospholipid phosphatase